MASHLFLRFLIIFLILVLLDGYIFQGIRALTKNIKKSKIRPVIHTIYWIINGTILFIYLYYLLTYSKRTGSTQGFSTLAAATMLLYVPKIIFLIFLLLEDAYRLFRKTGRFIGNMYGRKNSFPVNYSDSRRRFVSQVGLSIAAVPFFSILHGITKGKYNFKVWKHTLYFPNLPDAFDGFTITQLSDIHAGSFDDKEAVIRGIQLVNEQQSNLIVFTGDLVNNRYEEMLPWMDTFSQLQAPFGKFSVLGNHDYGEYIIWDSEDAKEANLENLKSVHKELGFNLLLNKSAAIKKGNQSISLLGVENWGPPPFPQKGDLVKASTEVGEEEFKILLSHDPSHWKEKVLHFSKFVHLTLSGHTHGMQFGVEIPGFKWSPVKYLYPQWAGLYEQDRKYLYVNRGFGFIGFAGRVGIWPEITVLTLKKGNAIV